MNKVTFENAKSPFYKSLKKKVDAYFSDNNVNPLGNRHLYIKGVVQVATAITIYMVLVLFNPGVVISILLCAILGVNFAAIGFNVMHEGGHRSYSRHQWLNNISAYSLNAMGGNSYFWKIKHNRNHHTFTNIEGLDSDIDAGPFFRLHTEQKKYWFHRFQHLYWVFFYSISYLAWIFVQDFQKYFTGKVAGSSRHNMVLKEHFIFWGTKILYVFLYLVLPIFMLGFIKAIIGFMITAIVCGIFISIVFQLAHLVEGTHFPVPDVESNKIENEWAVHQVSTTANFATKSRVTSWLLGGLNFQVEHHLFPNISHVHYPKINKLVKETCLEFNAPYIEYSTVLKAFYSHLTYLKRLGVE